MRINNLRNYMNRARGSWQDLNIKAIDYPEIEDLLDAQTDISQKTKANMKSCLHDFWTWPQDAMWVLSSNPDVKMPVAQIEMISFMKNLALMGAMLLVMANGPGPMSFDSRLTGKKAQ